MKKLWIVWLVLGLFLAACGGAGVNNSSPSHWDSARWDEAKWQ